MRVPTLVRPSTNISAQPLETLRSAANPQAFGMGVSEALGRAGQALQQLHANMEAERERLAAFEVQRRVISETTQLNLDLMERQQNAPLGAAGFADAVAQDYEARHNSMLEEFRQQGVPEQALQELELRLANLRGGAVMDAAQFQQRSRTAQAAVEVNEVGLNLTQLASAVPYAIEDALAAWDETIDLFPGVDAITKESLRGPVEQAIKEAAGMGLAQQDPQTVVNSLTMRDDPSEFAAKGGVVGVVAAGAGWTEVQYADGTTARVEGTRAWRNNNPGNIEYGDFARRYGAVGTDGRFAVFPDYESGRRAKEALIFESQNYRNLTINEAINRYAPPSENNTQAYVAAVAGALGVPASTPVSALSQQQRQVMLDAMEQVEGFRPGTRFPGQLNAHGKTGNPVLDALDPRQRQSVLNAAQTALNQQQVAARGELETRVANAEAAYLQTGSFDGREPAMAEFFNAYGPEAGLQRWAAFDNTRQIGQHIQAFRTLPADQIAAAVEGMLPTDTASPTYAVDLAGYEQASAAMRNVLQQREANPAAYVQQNFPAVAQAWENVATSDNPSFARSEAYHAMAEAYRQLGMRPSQMMPIPDNQVQPLVESLQAMPPEQQVQELVNMRREMGALYGNGLQQIAEAGATTQAYLSGLVNESPAHTQVAANVLRGQQILANDPTRRPQEGGMDGLQTYFREALGAAQNTLPPEAVGAIYDSVKALYVFKGGAPDIIDPVIFDQAIREVLGGFADDPDTGIVQINPPNTGWFSWNSVPEHTILPPGINRYEFTSWIEGLDDRSILDYSYNGSPAFFDDGNETPVTASDIASDGVFVRVAPGLYMIKMSSDGKPIVDQDGQRYLMQVFPATIRNSIRIGDEG